MRARYDAGLEFKTVYPKRDDGTCRCGCGEEVVPPRQLNPDVPAELEDIVLRCLEKDPEHRYQDVSALRCALRELALEDAWSSDLAAEWWSCNGCPERKKLAAELVEAAAV